MKKLLIIALCFFSSFSNAQKIGVLMDSYNTERWISDRNFICQRVQELGGECLIEVAKGSAELQLDQAKTLIDMGVKVLIVVPVDITESFKIVDYAAEKNVKVIAYDRVIASEKTDLYLSFDNEKVGMLQAERAVKAVGKGNYILLNGPRSDYNAILYRKGQLEVLRPYMKKGEIKLIDDIVLNSWTELNAFLAIQELALTHNEQVNAVLAANDVLANGVISALSDFEDIGPVYITGQDAEIQAVQNLINDVQDMTVYKPIKKLAFLAAESAISLSKNKLPKQATSIKIAGVNVKTILLEPMVVTKENYMETVIADNHVSIDQLTTIKKK